MFTHRLACVLLLALMSNAHRPHDVVHSLAVSEHGQYVFIFMRGFVYRSDDGGLNWELLPPRLGLPYNLDCEGRNNVKIVLSPAFEHDKTLFLLSSTISMRSTDVCSNTKTMLLRSNNAGVTWVTMHDFENSTMHPFLGHFGSSLTLSQSFAQDGIVLLGSKNGEISRSVDRGTTFDVVHKASAACSVVLSTGAGMLAATQGGDILESLDEGASWKLVTTLSHRNVKASVTSMAAINQTGHITLLVGTMQGAFLLKGSLSLLSSLRWRVVNHWTKFGHVANVGFADGVAYVMTEDGEQLMMSRDMGTSWSSHGNDIGLHVSQMAHEMFLPSFTSIHGCTKVGRTFLASFTGVYRSDNQGKRFMKIDTISKTITSLDVTKGTGGSNSVALSVCSYAGGCFGGEINVTAMRHTHKLPDGWATKWPAVNHSHTPGADAYVVAAKSPTYNQDRLILRSQWVNRIDGPDGPDGGIIAFGLDRSEDGGATWKMVLLPRLQNSNQAVTGTGFRTCVQSIVFSPNFADDKTVFVSGYNIGVAVSTDAGRTFTTKWTAAWENGQVVEHQLPNRSWQPMKELTPLPVRVKLVASPEFASDRALVALVDNTQLSGKYGTGHNKIVAALHLSRDGGDTWSQLGGEAGWQNVQLGYSQDRQLIVVGVADGKLMLHSSKGWVELAQSGEPKYEIGRAGTMILPSTGEVLASWVRGGMLRASLNITTGHLITSTIAGPDDYSVQSDEAFAFVQLVPGDGFSRGTGHLIAKSPFHENDGVIFGAYFYSIFASFDRGTTWHRVFKFKHVYDKCNDQKCAACQDITGDAKMTLSDNKSFMKELHGNFSTNVWQYCLWCGPGFDMDAETGKYGAPCMAVGAHGSHNNTLALRSSHRQVKRTFLSRTHRLSD